MRSLEELMSLEGRVAVITGGAGHLGRTIAETLAELGARIVLIDIATAEGEKVAAEVSATYRVDVEPLMVDLADEAALRGVPAAVLKRFGRLDVLVNNAALVGTSDLLRHLAAGARGQPDGALRPRARGGAGPGGVGPRHRH